MENNLDFLKAKAVEIRKDIVKMVYNAKSGHIGGSMSIVETLIALYYQFLNFDIHNPKSNTRDRFVLSKGHTAPALYAVLADVGFFPKERLFDSYRHVDSLLQGHPDLKKTPGVDMSTGSLGMGLSVGCGMAWGAKLQGLKFHTYVMLGDGEINEGQVWEAAATIAHNKIDNLTAFVDLNGLQNDGTTCEVKNMDPVGEKWEAFNWNVIEINGHDFEQIIDAVQRAKETKGKPTVILLHTVKGKGVSFMENSVDFHGKTPSAQEYEAAMGQLCQSYEGD